MDDPTIVASAGSAHSEGSALTFEEALRSLEQTVEELRSDGLSLARALDLHEQGTQLAAYCEHLLTTAEIRLTRLDPATGASSASEVVVVHEYEMEADW